MPTILTPEQKTIYDKYMDGYITGREGHDALVSLGISRYRAWIILGIDPSANHETWEEEKERLIHEEYLKNEELRKKIADE